MSKKSNGKQRKRVLKQLEAKNRRNQYKSIQNAASQPVTRMELYNIQNTMDVKSNSALMGLASIVNFFVDAGLITYDKFKELEKEMVQTHKLIQKFMQDAYGELGEKAKLEEVSDLVYKNAKEAGIRSDILVNVFGAKPLEDIKEPPAIVE